MVKEKKVKDGKWLLFIVLVVVLLVLFFTWRWWQNGKVAVKVVPVTLGNIEAVVSASGLVDAPVYELGPKMGGKVVKLNVKEGARVFAGQTLAEFDDTTRLVAPANGLVAKVNLDEGETALPSSVVLVVVNYKRSWINAQIDEIDIADVKLSDLVRITSDVYPDKVFSGQIYWIAPLAELRKVGGRVKMDEESYVFPCKIKFLGQHDELKVNMSVNVDVVTKKKDNVLLIPREALFNRDDISLVYAIDQHRALEKEIKIGLRSFTSLEVTSGLSSGEIVAVSNLNKLKNKVRVKIEK